MSDFNDMSPVESYTFLHEFCRNNSTTIGLSKLCRCLHCLKTYRPEEIREWIDDGSTAVCPCGVDAVVGDAVGILGKFFDNDDLFQKAHDYWFGVDSVKTTNSDGNTFWRNKDGFLHRDPKEGPAIIRADGNQEYCVNGQRHRDPKKGPAVIRADGTQEYYFNGQRHRDPKEGPAVIGAYGTQQYWFNGRRL